MCSYLHIDKEVLRLDVTVNHFLGMAVGTPIRDLVSYINAQSDYYTSSSCSGRTVVFCEVWAVWVLM